MGSPTKTVRFVRDVKSHSVTDEIEETLMSSPSSSSSWTLSPDTSLDSDDAKSQLEWGTSSESTITPVTYRRSRQSLSPPAQPEFSTPSPSFSHSSLSSSPGSQSGGERRSLDKTIPLPSSGTPTPTPTPPPVQPVLIANAITFEDRPRNIIDLAQPPRSSAIHPRWQCPDLVDDVLSQPATNPGFVKILLVNRFLPWSISISASSRTRAVSVGDVLGGVHRALFTPVSESEYQHATPERQAQISRAFHERVARRGDPESKGQGCLRRVDYLEGNWRFAGLSVVQSSPSQHVLRFSVRP